MQIAVLGTGPVSKIVAGKLLQLNHSVSIGTRDPAATLARTETDMMGIPPFAVWQKQNPAASLVTFAQAARSAQLIVNATVGAQTLSALELAGEENLAGKVLLDLSNPLDFSKGMPPSLSVCNTDSLGEQIQKRLPRTQVVKALNTTNAFVMVDPKSVGGGDHSIFVCGNDGGAKKQVSDLLAAFGWKDIIDLGDITAARGTEMILPLWIRLFSSTGNPMFNFKVVR